VRLTSDGRRDDLRRWHAAQLALGKPNSGSWDINTVNETGPRKGRHLFTVFETGQSGESWQSDPQGSTSPYGRLFEITNPIDAPALHAPSTPGDTALAGFVHRAVVPRTSHEGIQFDKAGNMYLIDELNGGNIYTYTPAASFGDVMSGNAEYFAAGRTSVLRVGDGNTPNATGAFTWAAFADQNGAALPGALTITDHPSSGNDRTIEITIR
jgi:uncharacterized protein